MTRIAKRELIARVVSVLAVVTPISLGAIGGILLYTYLGWEGRAGAIFGIGAAFTVGMGVAVATSWEHYSNTIQYPLVYKNNPSWLREWIEEPEAKIEEKPKSKPRPEAWKED